MLGAFCKVMQTLVRLDFFSFSLIFFVIKRGECFCFLFRGGGETGGLVVSYKAVHHAVILQANA